MSSRTSKMLHMLGLGYEQHQKKESACCLPKNVRRKCKKRLPFSCQYPNNFFEPPVQNEGGVYFTGSCSSIPAELSSLKRKVEGANEKENVSNKRLTTEVPEMNLSPNRLCNVGLPDPNQVNSMDRSYTSTSPRNILLESSPTESTPSSVHSFKHLSEEFHPECQLRNTSLQQLDQDVMVMDLDACVFETVPEGSTVLSVDLLDNLLQDFEANNGDFSFGCDSATRSQTPENEATFSETVASWVPEYVLEFEDGNRILEMPSETDETDNLQRLIELEGATFEKNDTNSKGCDSATRSQTPENEATFSETVASSVPEYVLEFEDGNRILEMPSETDETDNLQRLIELEGATFEKNDTNSKGCDSSTKNHTPENEAAFSETVASPVLEYVSEFEDGNGILEMPSETDETDETDDVNKKERKKNSCYYCHQLVTCSNYSRHLLRKHKNEIDVVHINALPKKSIKRRALLKELVNKGNYLHNSVDHESSYIPARRPLHDQSPKKKHFVTCSYCLVMIKRKNFFLHRKLCWKCEDNRKECKFCKKILPEGLLTNSKHYKHCENKPNIIEDKQKKANHGGHRRVLQSGSIFVNADSIGGSKDLIDNVLPLVRLDEKGEVVKKDALILRIGSKLRSNHKEHQAKTHITSKMRDLASLLIIMQKWNSNIKCFKDCLKSQNVQLLFKAVQELSGFDETTGIVGIPSMPARLKTAIHLALDILRMDIRADQNISYESKKELIFDFQTTEEYMRKDWKFVISTNAAKSANAKRRNKVPLMPLEADIKTMSTYLTELENSLYDKLKECPDPNLFEKMCEAVIADLIVFNCRRAGEVARAELNDYLSRNNVEFEGNLESLLSPSELAAKASLTTFYILGKRGRSVPILMTETMKKCVDLLVTLRDKLEVPNKNKLLFPRLYSDRPYDSCRIIRDLKSKVNLQKPDHFTSTGLRHEVATHSKIQNADKNYTSVLASHMGHTESVHESNYQLPVPLLQVSKVGARLLERRGKCDGESIEKEQSQSRQAPAAMDPTLQHPSQSITETETEDEKKDPTYEEDENQSEDSSVSFSEENIKTKERPVKRDTSTTRSWTSDEYSIVLKSFAGFLRAKKRPGKVLCEKLLSENPCLNHRNWISINTFIDNVIRGKKKLSPEQRTLVYG